jgi:hypothetical protein
VYDLHKEIGEQDILDKTTIGIGFAFSYRFHNQNMAGHH